MREASNGYMGFDDYIYIVTAIDEDGSEYEYEYGNLKHAMEHYRAGKKMKIERYKDGQRFPVEIIEG